MTKLGLALPMHKDELTLGYFCRIAKLNHREPYFFADDLGMSFPNIINGDVQTLKRFADLTATDFSLLNANFHRDGTDTNLLIRGQSLRRKSFVITRFRYCPCCIMGDIERKAVPRFAAPSHAIQRLNWSVRHLRTCREHNIVLCDEPAQNNPQLDYDFSRKVEMLLWRGNWKADSEKAVGGEFENYVGNRLDGRTDEHIWLDKIELGVAAQLCERLGIMAMRGVDAQISAFSEFEMIEAANVGFAIASKGRESVKHALAEAARSADLQGQSKPQKVFGEFFKWLAFTARASAYSPIKDLLREVAIDNVPLQTRYVLLGEPVGERGRRLVIHIAKDTNIHPKKLRKHLRLQGALETRCGIETVDYQTGMKAAKLLKTGLSFKDLIDYLGADRTAVKVIAERYTGKLATTRQNELNRIIDRETVDEFIDRLKRSATPVDVKPDGTMNIPTASKRTNRHMHEIIDLILDASLTRVFVHRNAKPFASILVDPREIRTASAGTPMQGLSIDELAKRFQLNPTVVGKLLEHGCIASVTATNPLNRCPQQVVKEEVAIEFFNTYAFNKHLAEARGLHPKSMLKALLEKGIKPIFNPYDVGAFIFLRSSVTPF